MSSAVKILKIKLYNNENYLPYDYGYDQSEMLLAVWAILALAEINNIFDYLKINKVGDRFLVGNVRMRIMDNNIVRIIRAKDEKGPDYFVDINIDEFTAFLNKYNEIAKLKVKSMALKRIDKTFDVEIIDSAMSNEIIAENNSNLETLNLRWTDGMIDDRREYYPGYWPENENHLNSEPLMIVWSVVYGRSTHDIIDFLIYNKERLDSAIFLIDHDRTLLLNLNLYDEFGENDEIEENNLELDKNNFLNFMIKYSKFVSLEAPPKITFKFKNEMVDVELLTK